MAVAGRERFQPSRPVTGAEAIDAIAKLEALAGLCDDGAHAGQPAHAAADAADSGVRHPGRVRLSRLGARVFATAGLTDALDGVIARRSGQKTTLGAWLDPMADKLLLVTTFIVLTLPDSAWPTGCRSG